MVMLTSLKVTYKSTHTKSKNQSLQKPNFYCQFQMLFKSFLWFCFQINSSKSSLNFLFFFIHTKHLFIKKTHLVPVKQSAFKDSQRRAEHSRHSESTWHLGTWKLGNSVGTQRKLGNSDFLTLRTLGHPRHFGH